MSKRALSTGGKANESLKWEVFVAPGIPTAARDLPPDTKQGMWSPISSTLIYGKRDAVLVDAFITVEQAARAPGLGRGERQESDDDLRSSAGEGID